MKKLLQLLALFLCGMTIACHKQTGTLEFRANGEEFIKQGLISKEGWHLQFDQLLINIANPTAYHCDTDLPELTLKGNYLCDLTKGTKEDPSVLLKRLEQVQPGNYQSLRFSVEPLETGEYAGYSIILCGTAEKESAQLPFEIKLSEGLTFVGQEGYVGDSIKGLLNPGGTTDVEMTFHFDHLFGNQSAAQTSHVNIDSPGFALFANFAKEGVIQVDQNQLINSPNYSKLMKALQSLGHLGEGHCTVIR